MYKIRVSYYDTTTLEPAGFWSTDAWMTGNPGEASAAYHAACQTLQLLGGNHRDMGVFLYKDGLITDRYLVDHTGSLVRRAA